MRLVKKLALFSLLFFFVGGSIYGISEINKKLNLLNSSKVSDFDVGKIELVETSWNKNGGSELVSEGKSEFLENVSLHKQKENLGEEILKFQDLKIGEDQECEDVLIDTEDIGVSEGVVALGGEATTLVTEGYLRGLYTGEGIASIQGLGIQAVVEGQGYEEGIRGADLGVEVEADGGSSSEHLVPSREASSEKRIAQSTGQYRVFNMRVGSGGRFLQRNSGPVTGNSKRVLKILRKAVRV